MLPRERKRLRDMGKERSFKLVNSGSGPPAPPVALFSPSVCISCSPIPQPIPDITVSLSFSVGSHKDTNAGQSDPKQMRKEDPSGGTILEEPLFHMKQKSKS